MPIVELDASGTPDEVWGQLLAVGRLMRQAVEIGSSVSPGLSGAARTGPPVRPSPASDVGRATWDLYKGGPTN